MAEIETFNNIADFASSDPMQFTPYIMGAVVICCIIGLIYLGWFYGKE